MFAACLLGSLASLAPGALRVTGDSQCPSAPEVERAVADLGLSPTVGAQHQVLLARTGDSITAALLDPTNRLLAQRTFPLDARCQELAGAIAVVISLWETQLAAQPYAASLVPAPLAPAARPREIERRPRPHLEIGGGLLVSVSGGPAADAVLLLSLRDASNAWGGILTANWQDTRTLAVETSSATWQRLSLAIGLVRRLELSWGAVEVEAGGVLGILNAEGADFAKNLGGSQVDAAGRFGARLILGRAPGQPWVGAWGLYWGNLQLTPADTDKGSTVPRWELLTGAGVSYDFF